MNPALTLSFWAHLAGFLAIKIALVLVAAGLTQRLIRSAAWSRTLWRGVMLCLLALILDDISGLSPTLFQKVAKSPRPTPVARAEPSAEVRVLYQDLDAGALGARRSRAVRERPDRSFPAPASVWWPGYVWLAGIIWLGARWFLHGAAYRRQRAWVESRADKESSELARELARLMGIRQSLRIRSIRGLASPIASGWRKPCIGLPEDFSSRYSRNQQAAILAHELAHIKAGDPGWHLLGRLAVILCWWHPLAWWGPRQLQLAAELAADEASRMVPQGPEALAECLLQLAQAMARPSPLHGVGAQGHGYRSGLGRRIQRLLDPTLKTERPFGRPTGFVVMALELAALFALANGLVFSLTPKVMGQDRARVTPSSPAWNHSLVHVLFAVVTSEAPLSAEAAPKPAPGSNSAPTVSAADPDKLQVRTFVVDPATFKQQVDSLFSSDQAQLIGMKTVDQKLLDKVRESLSSIAHVSDPPSLKEKVPEFLDFLEGTDTAHGPTEFFSGIGALQSFQTASIAARPKALVYFNYTRGHLHVRATAEYLEAIERFIQVMNTPLAQVMIETKVFTMPEALVASVPLLSQQWYATNILTTVQTTQLVAQLKSQPGVDFLSAPRVTTLSGRQAQISVTVVKPLVVLEGSTFKTNLLERGLYEIVAEFHDKRSGLSAVNFNTGTTVDLVPYVRAGQSIQLNLQPSLLVFAGYEQDLVANSPGARINRFPQPRLLLTQFTSQAVLWSGQSVVCGPYPAPLASEELPFAPRNNDPPGRQVLYCIASVYWIDPAGNEVLDERSPNTIPEQEFY